MPVLGTHPPRTILLQLFINLGAPPAIAGVRALCEKIFQLDQAVRVLLQGRNLRLRTKPGHSDVILAYSGKTENSRNTFAIISPVLEVRIDVVLSAPKPRF